MLSITELIRETQVDPDQGLDDASVTRSRQRFGSNVLQPPPREPAWKKFLEKFDEPIIKILLGAALLQLVTDLFGESTRVGVVAIVAVALLPLIGLLIRQSRPWLPALSFVLAGVLAYLGAQMGHIPAEGLAVMVAVALATGVGFLSEYRSQREFELLNARTTERTVKAIRNGSPRSVALDEIVVGDVLLVETGDELPADGRVLSASNLQIDQSLLTGESEAVEKSASGANDATESSELPGCVYRGTHVVQGVGRVIVAAVGNETRLGQIAKSLGDSDSESDDRVRKRLNIGQQLTPLQLKLKNLAEVISKVGYVAAVAVFIAFIVADIYRGRITWPFANGAFQPDVLRAGLSEVLEAFIVMVVIIVVAVPEGLPMSVTISLALAMRKMTRANSLVRRMVACETIGSATIICTDKTGTLTQNQMRVVAIGRVGALVDGDALRQPTLTPNLPPTRPIDWLGLIAAVNSTANLEEKEGRLVPLGNPTEAALLLWLADHGGHASHRSAVRVREQVHFTSERKRMTTVAELHGEAVVLVKGSPEWVLSNTTHYLDEAGKHQPWTDGARQLVADQLSAATARAMRTLAFAFGRHGDAKEHDLIYVGHVAIRDPLRAEVAGAVRQCRDAGIAVMMITGDNVDTARAIAADVGLIDVDARILTSSELNALSDDEVSQLLPRLRVLARAQPLDKLRLVKLLQARGEVVAMTGDGTNDAPALKRADVGLSMGRAGTEVAKEASDIVLLDDSFATIVQAVHWGRALYENIQRFLQFQLTINVSALVIAFVGTLFTAQPPFTVLQMLWINVIMDTFAAIALCSEPPRAGLMRMRPKRRDESILTRSMMVTIGATAAFFVVVMLSLLAGILFKNWFSGVYYSPEVQRLEVIPPLEAPKPFGTVTYHQAAVFFTIYVFLQVWNQFNCRSLTPNVSGLRGLMANPIFLAITGLIVVGQVVIVTFGGTVFNVEPLPWWEWLAIAGATSSVIVFGELLRWIRRRGT